MSEPGKRYQLVLTTVDSEDLARKIARGLVEQHLAACVNVVERLTSVYRWKGEIVEDDERLLLIKSEERLFPRVRDAIRTLHSYEVPEVLALPIADGDPDYLAWIGECVERPGSD